MNSITGKSTGIALLMAAALLAALFAMGVFSATGVGAHEAPDHTSASPAVHDYLSGLAVVWVDDEGAAATPALTAPNDALDPTFDANAHSYTLPVSGRSDTLTITASGASVWGATTGSFSAKIDGVDSEDAENASLTVLQRDTSATPQRPQATGALTVDLTNGIVKTIEITADDTGNNANAGPGAGTYTINLEYIAANSDRTPAAGVIIDLDWDGDTDDTVTAPVSGSEVEVSQGGDIVVKLPMFGMPDEDPDPDTVTVYLTDDTGAGSQDSPESPKPSDVTVEGTTITLTMGAVDDQESILDERTVEGIKFSKKAGITNPKYGNEAPDSYKITVVDEEDDEAVGYAAVLREVSVKPASGARGKEITVTGKGFSDGTTSVLIGDVDDPHTITVESDKGLFTRDIDTSIKDNDDEKVFDAGPNIIGVSDAAGRVANTTATFTIKASFTISPEPPVPGAAFVLTLTDATVMEDEDEEAMAPVVKFASKTATEHRDVDNDDTKVSTWKYIVPDVSTGSLRVTVSGLKSGDIRQTVTIGSNTLEVDVEEAVPGQEISITGTGFSDGAEVDGTSGPEDGVTDSSVKIGGQPVNTDDIEDEEVDGNGNISLNVKVPNKVQAGKRTVEVRDSDGRIGRTSITISRPVIKIDPTESRIGEPVTVTGTGFPANDVVFINYNGKPVDGGSQGTSPMGEFEVTILVPNSASVGKTVDITAVPQLNDESTAAKAVKHTTPKPVLTVGPESAAAGSKVSVSGMNFKGFTTIDEITIGNEKVTPVPAPITDRDGSFTAPSVLVPNLSVNRYAVKATDSNGDSGTGYVSVVLESVVVLTDPADVFADLIADGSLSTVWHLDASTQSWTSFSTNPALADFNDLTVITGGQVYVLIMSAAGEFQGKALFAGTNQVFIP